VSPSWRKTRLLPPLAVIAILLGAAAPGAAAETHLQMSLPSSNGYRLAIFGTPGAPVALELTKRTEKGIQYTTYSIDGAVTPREIKGNFGRFGRIDVSFRPNRPGGRPSRGCGSKGLTRERGTFVGTIRFRGEQGYSSASATRAKGTVLHFCSRASKPWRNPLQRTVPRASPAFYEISLVAEAERGRQEIELQSETVSPLGADGTLADPTTVVSAEIEEEQSRIGIKRTAIVLAEPPTPSPLGATPTTALLTLPNPFSGTGSYREEAGVPASWTGDLRVDLPGAENQPLVGPDFTAVLCRGKSGNGKFRRCLERQP
jgi:hypothetical protein